MPLQSDVFLVDSQTALALLSTAPPFLQLKQLKSFWDIWTLFDSLFFRVAQSF